VIRSFPAQSMSYVTRAVEDGNAFLEPFEAPEPSLVSLLNFLRARIFASLRFKRKPAPNMRLLQQCWLKLFYYILTLV